MPAAAGSPSPVSSPAGDGGVGFSTPDTGRDLIHAAQLSQLGEQLGQLDESFPGFGEELKAALPGLPEDADLLKRSRHTKRALSEVNGYACSRFVTFLLERRYDVFTSI